VDVAKGYRVSFHDLVFLEIDIKERKDVFGLNQEGNLAAVFKILVGADVNFLDFKWEVGDVGFGDDGFFGFAVAVDFVLVAEEGVASADDKAVVKDGDDDEIVLLVFEVFLGKDVRDELAEEAWLGGTDGWKANLDLLGEDEALLLQVCVYSIRHYLIKIIQKSALKFVVSLFW
jgi:hypothetical protein